MVILLTVFELSPFKKALQNALTIFLLLFFFFNYCLIEGILQWPEDIDIQDTHLRCCHCCLVAKLCLPPCHPMDCSPPGSSVHGISQARILKWVAISFSRESSRLRNRTSVFYIADGLFITKPLGKPTVYISHCFRRLGSIPGSERSPKGGNGYPLQYSCLKNSTDRGFAKRQTQLRDWACV